MREHHRDADALVDELEIDTVHVNMSHRAIIGKLHDELSGHPWSTTSNL
jgi:hypothetical protein